ncbi:MAG: insecticidal toxin complex protein [Chitinophagaceae bacterium]|nr:insecticidal toxin complex protein [Chitinophagaceae bacterium]
MAKEHNKLYLNTDRPDARQSVSANRAKQEGSSSILAPPVISLPKGGGAIKSIDEKFEVNAVNGSATFSIPLPSGSARGFGVSLGLSYNSGSGNGVFGMGWSLSLPSIRRKTEKELPQYFDDIDSDTYVFAGAEDLVPKLKEMEGVWVADERDSPGNDFAIKLYRPRIEGGFSRIERWTNKADGIVHWKVISKDNITSIFGNTRLGTIADPSDPRKIFEWFPCFTYDDKGNCALYEYEQEDGAGIDAALPHNRNRTNGNAPFTNTYLKRVRSGNINPYAHGAAVPGAREFLFETVFDYGEHDKINAPFLSIRPWTFRADAFSDYRAGFEIRTCRLCERVLMYHHFAELPGGSALIRSVEFKFDNNGQIGNFTFLKEVFSTGYIKQINNTYTQKSLPPASFSYQKHEWNKDIKNVTRENVVHSPVGIYEPGYQWVDLYSEGLNGILTMQGEGLFYKQNLGDGAFSKAQLITPKPSLAGTDGQLQLQELESDGTKYLSRYDGILKGFFKINDETEWEPFKPFEQLPNIDFNDSNIRLLDLNGDGKAEILITEDNVFSWYPSMGEKGFDTLRKVQQHTDEEKGARIVFNDQEQSIFLSDMNGDGLTDIVRIRNGSVCYWPNLGYGKFGAKVSMDSAPVFDHPGQYNAAFIKLADIDGSGTTDIIYLGKNKFQVWLNQSGNSFLAAPEEINPFPEITNLSQISVIDFLGNGTSCILWSSKQTKDQHQPLRYIDLMNSKKPHIMAGYKNNMGKEVELTYTASTYYYLKDREEGHPWITKLPFPVHCLSKVVTYDRIMKTRFASEYSYHHGYYDHAEREFRGFGRVEQKDAEDVTHFIKETGSNNLIQQDLHQPPVLIKTWFHTGAFLDQEKILTQFAHEYSQNTIHQENLLPQPVMPGDLSINEMRQALRACKGMMLRKEVYALDNTPLSDKPYTVEQQNCLIRLVQPGLENKYASFIVLNSETISYHYERDLSDPRIAHSFVLEVDDFANIKKSASLVYKRKVPSFPEQSILYTTYCENDFTNTIDTDSDYRLPVSFQTKLFEITGLGAPAGNYYTLQELKTACVAAVSIDYHVLPNETLQKRLMQWNRMQFKGDNAAAILPFGSIESKALVHQTYKATFNESQLTNIFNSKISFADLNTILLHPSQGGHTFADNYFWIPSGTSRYDTAHFFHPVSYTDPLGNVTDVQYDSKYHLFIEKTTDALDNEIKVKGFNYRVLQPYLMEDSNNNLAAVRFDDLGIAVKTFSIGKKGIDAGDEFDDTLAEMSSLDVPSSEIAYHVFEWFDQSSNSAFDLNSYKAQPNFLKTRLRETHYHADPLHQTRTQESYTYFGGSGQEVMTKVQAEPGEALQVNPDGTVTAVNTSPHLRWIGNGRTLLNNKGNPVKQYEPYFSATTAYDDEKEMVELGVTPVIHYDPMGRVVRTDAPDKTFNKIEFTAWHQKIFDANDTVKDSQWYINRGSPDPLLPAPASEEQKAAWLAAKHHNTPSIAHLDTLGRIFFTEADNITEKITSHVRWDIEGKELEITDTLDRKVMHYEYDMLGREIHKNSIDAGQRWLIMNSTGNPLRSWDDRDHEFQYSYDPLHRPLSSRVTGGDGGIPLDNVFDRIIYGESGPSPELKNLKGKIFKHYDTGGLVETPEYDFKGQPKFSTRKLFEDYKSVANWTDENLEDMLEEEIYTFITETDALGRITRQIAPDGSIIVPYYNEAGLLNGETVTHTDPATTSVYIKDIDYNEKGRITRILYGNDVSTRFYYDKETFRLNRLESKRQNNDPLQDWHYIYDPVGNITHIEDKNIPVVFFNNQKVTGVAEYVYDALYRLVSATGRENDTSLMFDNRDNWNDLAFIRELNPGGPMSVRNYTQSYQYDRAGNMRQMRHLSAGNNWTRDYTYQTNNNRLKSTQIGDEIYQYPHHDQHGFITVMPHLEDIVWNFREELVRTIRQKRTDGGTPEITYYQYDSDGQRIRKITDNQASPDSTPSKKEERIYIAGYELYKKHSGTNAGLERTSLALMDKDSHFVMIETRNDIDDGTDKQVVRYQLHNHLGSAALELDHLAQVISYEEYHPYGTTAYQAKNATIKTAAKRYRYTGMERDEETGLEYHGARYYLPWLGRWLATDPAGIEDGCNLYVYSRNNPVVLIDTNGRQAKTPKITEEDLQTYFVELVTRQEPYKAIATKRTRGFTRDLRDAAREKNELWAGPRRYDLVHLDTPFVVTPTGVEQPIGIGERTANRKKGAEEREAAKKAPFSRKNNVDVDAPEGMKIDQPKPPPLESISPQAPRHNGPDPDQPALDLKHHPHEPHVKNPHVKEPHVKGKKGGGLAGKIIMVGAAVYVLLDTGDVYAAVQIANPLTRTTDTVVTGEGSLYQSLVFDAVDLTPGGYVVLVVEAANEREDNGSGPTAGESGSGPGTMPVDEPEEEVYIGHAPEYCDRPTSSCD